MHVSMQIMITNTSLVASSAVALEFQEAGIWRCAVVAHITIVELTASLACCCCLLLLPPSAMCVAPMPIR
jgi:hypothetical protein